MLSSDKAIFYSREELVRLILTAALTAMDIHVETVLPRPNHARFPFFSET
jgi:hypothetical protein